MRLTDRDHEMIRLVHRYRFLSSTQLVTLVGGSVQQVIRRLQLLYHNRYLERPRCQIDFYHRGGSRPMVYGLADRGAALLRQQDIPVRGSRWSFNNRSVGRPYLEHVLLVSEIMVAIELASRDSGVKLLTSRELGPTPPFRWQVDINREMKLGLIPDHVFGLQYQGADKQSATYFFLEADRGTMPVSRSSLSQTSMYRKLLAYQATWSQGIHKTRFGLPRFRVLTVTTSASRKQAIIEACGRLRSGQGLFLFADGSILDNPRGILSAFWQTGRPGKLATLLS